MSVNETKDGKPATTSEEPSEPYLADPGNLAEAAQWLTGAVVGGVVGNAAYDLIKALLKRHGRQRLMAKVREILPSRATAPDVEPKHLENRVEEALDKAEEK